MGIPISPLPRLFALPPERPIVVGVAYCEQRAADLRFAAEQRESCARAWEALSDLRESDEAAWAIAKDAVAKRMEQIRAAADPLYTPGHEREMVLAAIEDARKATAPPAPPRKPRDPYACPECGNPHCCSSAHRSGSGD